jgi:flagellar FliL protein
MPEFLVVTTRQNVVDVVKHLISEDGLEIQVEDDFTKGLKAIFYRLPEVVFIQEEIAGITAQKVAGQVKTLLDDEPIRMVLLREQVAEWDTIEPSFDSIIDTSLSFDNLLGRFREELKPTPAVEAESNDGGKDGEANDTLAFSSWDIGDEIDPFSDMFPVQYQNKWTGVSPGSQPESREAEAVPRPVLEAPYFEEEFSFETPGDIVSTLPAEKDEPKDLKAALSAGSAPPASDSEKSDGGANTRLMDRESPHRLFASMSDDEPAHSDAVPIAKDNPSAPISDRLRLKGIASQNSVLKTDYVTKTAPSGISESDSQRQASSSLTASVRDRSPRQEFNPKEFAATKAYRENRLMRFLKPSILLVFLALATYLLLDNWNRLFHISDDKDEIVNLPQTDTSHSIHALPSFIPSVRPDATYSASHPGWERYPGGGIDYLVYRESGVIRAIQIIAGPDGKISEPFVRLCIRETTGLSNVASWSNKQNDGFQIETGNLSPKGEVALYRKMPEEEIRGIVLTFK